MSGRNLLVSVEELHGLLGNPGLRIIDCRFDLQDKNAGRDSYLAGHIPGAVFADLDKDLSGPVGPESGRHPIPDPAELAATFGRLGIANGNKVVVYDDCSGALAARAWWLLRWLGHDDAALLDGGLSHWQQRQFPVENGTAVVTESEFLPREREHLILTTEEIVAAGAKVSDLRLIDARDAVRFRGESEPIDTVAGHIPGAGNLPVGASLNPDGTWKPPDELARIWATILGSDENVPWSVMCGSGVTACHLVISGLVCGRIEPRLYVGSWSEWIRDPGRPISSGNGL